MAAHDIAAETNPALCAAVLREFSRWHFSVRQTSPGLTKAYLALPLVLSEELAPTFTSTNMNTGLVVWVTRNPQVLSGLAQRVNGSLEITTNAIRFGAMHRLLVLDEDSCLCAPDQPLKDAILTGPMRAAFKRARLLGIWLASAGSERTVLETFGVTV
jgi:hypothetical protein